MIDIEKEICMLLAKYRLLSPLTSAEDRRDIKDVSQITYSACLNLVYGTCALCTGRFAHTFQAIRCSIYVGRVCAYFYSCTTVSRASGPLCTKACSDVPNIRTNNFSLFTNFNVQVS